MTWAPASRARVTAALQAAWRALLTAASRSLLLGGGADMACLPPGGRLVVVRAHAPASASGSGPARWAAGSGAAGVVRVNQQVLPLMPARTPWSAARAATIARPR